MDTTSTSRCEGDPPLTGQAVTRRTVISGAAVAATSVSLGALATQSAVASTSRPSGPRAVSGAPGLPPGFTETFTSRYVNTGDVRLHAVIGGDGPPLLLIHGWPETWYAWRHQMQAFARCHRVVAVDQRGIGLSDKPRSGYDTETLANDLVGLMNALGHDRFSIVGHDVGMVIAYAIASDYRDRVDRLVVAEAPLPGVAPSPPLFVPDPINNRLWHISFNRTSEINEQLVRGREDIYFSFEFETATVCKLPSRVVRYYIDVIASDSGGLRGSFGFYRALDTTIEQNMRRMTRRLTLPVLAIGGAMSGGENIANSMKLTADDVESVVIAGAGHFVAEEAPEATLAAITSFLSR
jgi:pimeloyl-ACP methyl ester carboxylesterase